MSGGVFWRSLFANSSDALFELSGSGVLIDVNPVFLEWLGLPRSAVVGRPLNAFCAEPLTRRNADLAAGWSDVLLLQTVRGNLLVSVGITAVDGSDEEPVRAVGIARRIPDAGAIQQGFLAKLDELDTTQLVTINTIARVAEFRDPHIGAHLERVRLYTYTLANWLAEKAPGGLTLSESQVIELSRCAVLHDVGKAAVPERILHKPGRLEPDEWLTMQRHAIVGEQFLNEADGELKRLLGVSATFLSTARLIARHHHERFDGNGYPDRLRGSDIPLVARIVALADVYDALTSPRVYKPAWSHQRARARILAESGRHFDPLVVQAFLGSEMIIASAQTTLQEPPVPIET